MADTRKTIISDLVAGLDGLPSVTKATDLLISLDRVEEKFTPYIGLVVEPETPMYLGSKRYQVSVGLYVITKQSFTGIEDLISDVKDYLDTATIDNVLQLTYVGHDETIKEDDDDNKLASTKINFTFIYADPNDDTAANAPTDVVVFGFQSISHRKVYDLMVSGSIVYQPLGTNVYDSHRNANIIVPAGSGSLSVDIITSDVMDDQGGLSGSENVDDNAVALSIRAHFNEGTQNTLIMPFMHRVINELRSNVDLGDSYRLMIEVPFRTSYDQIFDISGTTGAEQILIVNRYWAYAVAAALP